MSSSCLAWASPSMARTAGAKRGVKALPGVEEDVGMIGLHWGGTFIELVPWTGRVTWQVCSCSSPACMC